MMIDIYKDRGLLYFSETVKDGRATNYANTYILTCGNRKYVIDSSCGNKRLKRIKRFLNHNGNYTILCTHYHNDHIANNGRLAGKNTPIIYHENVSSKINYLRTNASGQILRMYRDMPKEGFLKRLGVFNDSMIKMLLKRKVYSRYIAEPLLFTVSYILSLKSIGRIYSGKKHVKYLRQREMVELNLNGMKIKGWVLDDSFYALEAPGHSDCHTVYYDRKKSILIAGDALNFLTPNDIQFGTIKETIESQEFLLELSRNEKIELLCQGHYPPVAGNEKILSYISDIIEKHKHIYNLTSSFIKDMDHSLTFDVLYTQYCSIDDPVIKRLKKITFPRSTLVFLDVYFLKMIEECGVQICSPPQQG
jgi:glyoxylase-like metal-dependent hydrolase (beta-lactamase superfamily II)